LKKGLYFLAILPPKALAQKVQAIKKEFADKYDSKEAYKRPAHFTLIAPFKIPEKQEEIIIPQLIYFAEEQKPFRISLSGFNHFRDDVIFIDVEEPSAIKMLHGNLLEHLQNEMGFSSKSARPKSLTPHMTVAFRDLSSENFQKAWSTFKDRPFDYSFEVNSIFLLKHDYTQWQPFYEFTFSEG